MKVQEGDIYVARLERDFFGVFKVLQIGKLPGFDDGDRLMVGVLDFVSKQKPKLNDIKDTKILLQQKMSQNEYNICFLSSNPEYNNLKNYEYLGNLPTTEFEQSIEFVLGSGRDGIKGGYGLAGSMHPNDPNQAFLEWRWRNEREEYEKEIELSRKYREKQLLEYKKQKLKPKKMIDENIFWEVIEKINWKKDEDEEKMKPAIDFLAKMSVKEIKLFQESLTYKLYQIDTKEHAKNIGEYSYIDEEKYFSEDYFLYVRCCVIANGKDTFNETLENPKKMPKDMDFEPLLYIAEEAYEERVKKELDYNTGCNYETYSNYKGWN